MRQRARSVLEERRFGEAAALYRQLVQHEPRNARAHNDLGAALTLAGDPEPALRAFDLAVSLDPGFAEAHFNRGLALWNLGRATDALAAYRTAGTLDPKLFRAHLAEADALLQLGRAEEALESAERALGVRPGEPGALAQKGDTLRELGRLAEAEAAYREALTKKPDDSGILLALGICLDEQGRATDALSVLDKLVSLHPDDATARHNRAVARLHAKDAAGALEDEESVLARQPTFTAALAVRAQALEALGCLEDAARAWGKAMEVTPSDPRPLAALDALALGLGRSDPEGSLVRRWLAQAGKALPQRGGSSQEATGRALARFQQSVGLSPTGRLDGMTLLRLVSRGGGRGTGERD